jgi:predicted MFS family arabinose efflux permease
VIGPATRRPVVEHRAGIAVRAAGGGASASGTPGAPGGLANARLLVAFGGILFVLFPIPVITLFWKDQIGMSLADIMVLQAMFGLTVVLVEFPSGYFADRAGYRRSLLLGATLLVAGWLLYARATRFWTIAVAEVVLGMASAFVSGADRALLWVSLQASDRTARYTSWDGRMRAASQAAEAVSAAAGGWLYAQGPRWPFWCQVPAAGLTFLAAAALREVPRARAADHRSHARRAAHLLAFTLRHHRRLRATMALSVTLGLASFLMVWLIQPYMQARGVPTAWFGLLWAGAHAWLAAVSLASARVVDALGVRGTLLGCCLLPVIGYAGLAFSGAAWGVAFYLCFMTLRGLQAPVLAAVMQEDAPPEDRASVLSIAALLFRLAFVVVGPPIGVLVDRVGLETALGALALAFAPLAGGAFILFSVAHTRGRGGA